MVICGTYNVLSDEWISLCEKILQESEECLRSAYPYKQLLEDVFIVFEDTSERLMHHVKSTGEYPDYNLDIARTVMYSYILQRSGNPATETDIYALVDQMVPDVVYRPEPWPIEGHKPA